MYWVRAAQMWNETQARLQKAAELRARADRQ